MGSANPSAGSLIPLNRILCKPKTAGRNQLRETAAEFGATSCRTCRLRSVNPVSTHGNHATKSEERQRYAAQDCGWRTVRDSNPRDGSPPTHFPGVRLRPLGQLSVARCIAFSCRAAQGGRGLRNEILRRHGSGGDRGHNCIERDGGSVEMQSSVRRAPDSGFQPSRVVGQSTCPTLSGTAPGSQHPSHSTLSSAAIRRSISARVV